MCLLCLIARHQEASRLLKRSASVSPYATCNCPGPHLSPAGHHGRLPRGLRDGHPVRAGHHDAVSRPHVCSS